MNRRTQAEFWLERLNQAWEAVIPLGKLETYEDQETRKAAASSPCCWKGTSIW